MNDIDKLEAMMAAAEPAPVRVADYHPDAIQAANGHIIVHTSCSGMEGGGLEEDTERDYFIALRNAAPALFAEVRRLRAIEAAAWEMDNDIDLQMRASPDVYELWKCALAETKRLKAALAAKETP